MNEIKDAPWIGYCREEYEENCSIYDEEEEEYLAAKADDDYKRSQEGTNA